jgi:hypothetical protein
LAPIERVEVSTNGAWHQARLIGEPSRQAWQRWELVARINALDRPCCVHARRTKRAEFSLNTHAKWNRLGYGNNSIQELQFASFNWMPRITS